MIQSKTLAASVVVALALLSACGSESDAPLVQKTSIATTSAGALSVELLADGALSTGLNSIYFRITQAGAPVTDATVTVMPVMTMTGGTQHSCPVIGTPTAGPDGLYRVEAVFQMAGGMMGSWSIAVGITRPAASQVTATFAAVPVSDSGRAKTFSYFDPDTSVTTKYVASLAFPAAPKVGLNPVRVTFHRMATMMSFPAVTDAAVVLDPQMPSMGHGSPGSENPVHTADGCYSGKVSFSMAGTWETTVTFTRGTVTVGAPKFVTAF